MLGIGWVTTQEVPHSGNLCTRVQSNLCYGREGVSEGQELTTGEGGEGAI